MSKCVLIYRGNSVTIVYKNSLYKKSLLYASFILSFVFLFWTPGYTQDTTWEIPNEMNPETVEFEWVIQPFSNFTLSSEQQEELKALLGIDSLNHPIIQRHGYLDTRFRFIHADYLAWFERILKTLSNQRYILWGYRPDPNSLTWESWQTQCESGLSLTDFSVPLPYDEVQYIITAGNTLEYLEYKEQVDGISYPLYTLQNTTFKQYPAYQLSKRWYISESGLIQAPYPVHLESLLEQNVVLKHQVDIYANEDPSRFFKHPDLIPRDPPIQQVYYPVFPIEPGAYIEVRFILYKRNEQIFQVEGWVKDSPVHQPLRCLLEEYQGNQLQSRIFFKRYVAGTQVIAEGLNQLENRTYILQVFQRGKQTHQMYHPELVEQQFNTARALWEQSDAPPQKKDAAIMTLRLERHLRLSEYYYYQPPPLVLPIFTSWDTDPGDKLESHQKALIELEQALALLDKTQPIYESYFYRWINILCQLKQYDEAQRALGFNVQLEPRLKLFLEAQLLHGFGKTEESIDAFLQLFEQLLPIFWDSIPAEIPSFLPTLFIGTLSNLGVLYFQQGARVKAMLYTIVGLIIIQSIQQDAQQIGYPLHRELSTIFMNLSRGLDYSEEIADAAWYFPFAIPTKEEANDRTIMQFNQSVSHTIVLQQIQYEPNTNIMKDVFRTFMTHLEPYLRYMPGTYLIRGGTYGDSLEGNPAVELSKQREQILKTWLMESGVPGDQIELAHFPKTPEEQEQLGDRLYSSPTLIYYRVTYDGFLQLLRLLESWTQPNETIDYPTGEHHGS